MKWVLFDWWGGVGWSLWLKGTTVAPGIDLSAPLKVSHKLKDFSMEVPTVK